VAAVSEQGHIFQRERGRPCVSLSWSYPQKYSEIIGEIAMTDSQPMSQPIETLKALKGTITRGAERVEQEVPRGSGLVTV
jgi:hypothetical protein